MLEFFRTDLIITIVFSHILVDITLARFPFFSIKKKEDGFLSSNRRTLSLLPSHRPLTISYERIPGVTQS